MSTTSASVTVSTALSSAATALTLQIIDTSSAAKGDSPLLGSPINGISFLFNGARVALQSDDIYYALSYLDLVSAYRAAIGTTPALGRFSVGLGDYFYDIDPASGIVVAGQEVVLSSPGVISVDSFSGWLTQFPVANNYGVNASYEVSTAPVSIGSQQFTGTSANETIVGGTGDDVIDGRGGFDTAVFLKPIDFYKIYYSSATGTGSVIDSFTDLEGTDFLTSIERLQFADKTFDLINPPRSVTPAYGKADSFLFDASYYLLSNPDLVPSVTLNTALLHYKNLGAQQGRDANVWFDPTYYANRWTDLKSLNLNDATLFAHYNLYGVWEGRSAGPAFDLYDGARYLRDNPDVAAYVDANVKDFLGSRSNGAIAHYVIYGANEGRIAHDLTGNAIDLAILVGV